MTQVSSRTPFQTLNLPKTPVILAPLAGVSDHPFRRTCVSRGADLTYVEMISATALIYNSKRTMDMLERHRDEGVLGVQVTGKTAEEVGKAVKILSELSFETIDINMGCPVKKVVKTGCGSGILRDVKRVYETVSAAREATDCVLSAKIRLGWDHSCINGLEVADAIQRGGADFLTVHGRTRNDDYSKPVNLDYIAQIKQSVTIPVVGNGNLFNRADAEHMLARTGVDGLMVSRGALGNPWIFREIKGEGATVDLAEWVDVVRQHLLWQQKAYGDTKTAAICMRKHLLWYAKGWPGVKVLRDRMNVAGTLGEALDLLQEFASYLTQKGHSERFEAINQGLSDRFLWDPKFEMDRKLDRGVGDDRLEERA
ncbi:MAG: tRNA dihydrouridine synthase DusB [Pseudobacteriovorax sp.]|nr:tRNA dihydrouridine synthase DusB [Pseudobacteriovorax sp.]